MAWKHNEAISFTKPSREIHSVFLHCSASDNPTHDSVSTMQSWHIKRGFSEIGYHFFISKDGVIHDGRDLDKIPAAQKNHNTGSIAICLHGLNKDKFTTNQLESVKNLCNAIDTVYGSKKIKFRGHCEVSSKTCPVFDYKTTLQLDEQGHINDTAISIQSITTSAFAAINNFFDLFSTGEKVKEIQRFLTEAGYRTKVDGIFGQSTKLCVEAFQKANRLSSDGIAGPKTIEVMGTLKRGNKGSAVILLQKQLSIKGYRGLTDGNFGVKTESNVKAFQAASRLKSDGIAGKQTKLKLFGPISVQKLA